MKRELLESRGCEKKNRKLTEIKGIIIILVLYKAFYFRKQY